mmetsp:Transcript_111269/g.300130  ORF Transcript_111269/g.300130 Transcript_111269/m.300130 type:complete len:215 (+) Transcript_111269:348-992(+)
MPTRRPRPLRPLPPPPLPPPRRPGRGVGTTFGSRSLSSSSRAARPLRCLVTFSSRKSWSSPMTPSPESILPTSALFFVTTPLAGLRSIKKLSSSRGTAAAVARRRSNSGTSSMGSAVSAARALDASAAAGSPSRSSLLITTRRASPSVGKSTPGKSWMASSSGFDSGSGLSRLTSWKRLLLRPSAWANRVRSFFKRSGRMSSKSSWPTFNCLVV